MSQKRYLEFEVRGHPGNVNTVFNRLNAGLTGVNRQVQQSQRQLGMWERQWMAIGTTIRYALAGRLIFGISGLVNQLGEFDQRLGEIDALAGQLTRGGNLTTFGSQLNELGNFAQQSAIQLGIGVSDVQEHMQRFFSAFNPPGGPNQQIKTAREVTREVAQLQRALGREAGDPEALAGGVFGMVAGMRGGQEAPQSSVNRIANAIAYVIGESPVILGRDVARDIGRLGGAQAALRMTPEQIMAVYGAASMRGGSAAVVGRGVAQLLTSEMLKPETEEQKTAFAQMGLPTDPNALRQMGGWRVLRQMLQKVGGVQMTGAQAQALRSIEDPEEAIAQAGVRGPNITLASQAFGRIESFRQFLNLLSLPQGAVKALDDFVKGINKANEANLVQQRAERIAHFDWIGRLRAARSVIGIQAVRGFRPVLEEGLVDPASWLGEAMVRHPRRTQGAVMAGAGLAGLSALNRLFGGRIFAGGFGGPAVLRRGARMLGRTAGVAGMAAQQAMIAEALPEVLAGGEQLGQRGNPMWVIIHPASQFIGTAPGYGPLGGTPGLPGTGGGGKMGRLGRLARWGGGIAAALPIAGYVGYQAGQELTDSRFGRFIKRTQDESLLDILGVTGDDEAQAAVGRRRFLTGPHLRIPEGLRGQGPIPIEGRGAMDVTVRLVDPQGRPIKTERQEGVPVKYWGARTPPTSRGRPRRSGR